MLVKVDGVWYEVIECNRSKNLVLYWDDIEQREEVEILEGLYLSDEKLEVMRNEERRDQRYQRKSTRGD
ncbi:hypothetical protein HMPREF9260_00671 [Facklamia hominis ACS-120-V-Sch10]|nr:hypothetical protein HMPREF9260_00671 [Facklamia hominis ACS-120-V-Sch10]